MTPIVEKTITAWGTAPDWILVLAEECDKASQAKVARALKVSSTVVSRVLGNAYPGDMVKIEGLVSGHYMAAMVSCPVLEEIPRQRCISEQAKPLTFQNPLRKRVFDACRDSCPNSRLETVKRAKGAGS